MRIVTAAMVLCLSLLTISAVAQTTTTGSIEGTVTDPNGAAVPGATVTVSGANLIRAQSATTNDEGYFRIPNIPPGRYSVVVEGLTGFARFEQTQVEVNLSRTSTVNAALQLAGASEVVDVTATAGAAIDTTTTTTGTNVSTEQFSNFPTQRTVQSLYTIAPTVTRSGLRDSSGRDRDPSVAGASGPENNYILDGVTVTDPAFGGSGANLPFEFVQEVEIKTGAVSAEYGKATGGIFNVVTKSGSNDVRGDAFVYFTPKSFVRETTSFPFTGSAPNGFSEVDAGFDIGGPIVKDKLWFFGAFNPQRRKNYFLTQTFLNEVENELTTPFYAGKITWGITQNHIFNFSTFGDYTKQEGFLFGNSGFGADPNSFRGTVETGGSNYTARLNSTFSPNWIGEFSFGLHFQRANTIPEASVTDTPVITDSFAIRNGNNILTPVSTTATFPVGDSALQVAFVDGRGGTLERNFVRQGFGLMSEQDRDRIEGQVRFQNIWGKHTFKYGFELNQNRYNIFTRPTGTARTFDDPNLEEIDPDTGQPVAHPANEFPFGYRVTNNFGVCTVQGSNVACPAAALSNRVLALINAGQAPAGILTTSVDATLTSAQLSTNPFLVLSSVRIRDFVLNTNGEPTTTNTQGFYIQDDFKVTRNMTLNLGLRWDYQQSYGTTSDYLKFNSFKDNLQPRLGFVWDFTGEGRGKLFANFARFVETPIPLDINVRAGGDDIQLDRNINASVLNAGPGAVELQGTNSGLGCLGCHATPAPDGLKPQDVFEWTAGVEYEVARDFTLGFRGIYRNQDTVVEDGSFDDGTNYFLFNPGETANEDVVALIPGLSDEDRQALIDRGDIFGRARRYYRALEFTAAKRFTNNYQFIASYVYSSLIGNYEGLFRNDNGQSDPNITSLFDLPELLPNTYGRLPNDRPHQFKFDGTYRWPFGLLTSASFRAQSGTPFNELVPHFLYGNNEGFGEPRGTAINPVTGRNRTPTTYNLDLGFYYPLELGENRQLRFQLDWFNVTNAQRAITQDQTERINSGIPGAQFIQFFNPFYGEGLVFQFPSSLRAGVKFTF